MIEASLTNVKFETVINGNLVVTITAHGNDKMKEVRIEIASENIASFFNMWANAWTTMQNAAQNSFIQLESFSAHLPMRK